jgi:hypothetical protein
MRLNKQITYSVTCSSFTKRRRTEIHKMKKLKIGIARFLSFIETFLTDRSFRVKIDGNNGESENLKVGLPQRSKLGPQLFLVYIN